MHPDSYIPRRIFSVGDVLFLKDKNSGQQGERVGFIARKYYPAQERTPTIGQWQWKPQSRAFKMVRFASQKRHPTPQIAAIK
jgi:hypothetical protein